MTPTNELRFVERPIDPALVGVKLILQQKWVQNDLEALAEPRHAKYVWRDVPVVKEDGND